MFIALQKREENVAEYMLYMWQIEDIIRALELDINKIKAYVEQGYDLSQEQKEQVFAWYFTLSERMQEEGVQKSGHMMELTDLMGQLEEVSQQLLRMPSQSLYSSVYFQTLPSIIQLRQLSGGNALGEIETCFVGIYGYLTLKARGEEVSEETESSIKQFSTFLAMLADRFREVEEGKLILTPREEEHE